MPAPRPKLLKTYGNSTGRRFAAVQLPSGQRVDVLTRGPTDGSVANAWGSPHPFEETRRPMIYAQAELQARARANPRGRARGGRRARGRKNPPVVIFGNPPRQLTVAKILSRDVQELWYKHSYNGHQYYHPFDKGVTLQLLSDGSLRFVRPDGKPLWQMFPPDTR